MIQNSKPSFARKVAKVECKRNWSDNPISSSKGKGRTVMARRQMIITAKGIITGDITMSHAVLGKKGMKVTKTSSGNWIQLGLDRAGV